MEGGEGYGASSSMVPLAKWRHDFSMSFQYYLDRSTPHPVQRWIGTLAAALIYILSVYYVQGFYIISYGLGIYLLNLLIGFLSPKVNPELGVMDGPSMPTKGSDEFKPFILRLPGFQFWYVGLSSSGMTYKSSSAAYGSSSFQQNNRYGGFGNKKDGEMFKDSYRDRDCLGGDESGKSSRDKSRRGVSGDGEGKNPKKGSTRHGRDKIALSSSSKSNQSDDKYGVVPSQSSATPNDVEDDFDDFDPRGTSIAGSAAGQPAPATVTEVDLF